jgi:hypothetical protein
LLLDFEVVHQLQLVAIDGAPRELGYVGRGGVRAQRAARQHAHGERVVVLVRERDQIGVGSIFAQHGGGLPVTIAKMNWNDAAEDLLQQILAQTPRPVREAAEAQLRGSAERLAEDDGKSRVGVETVIAAWVANTPEAVRSDLPRQMERFGLDPAEYAHLLE